jgi:hypothetical protein
MESLVGRTHRIITAAGERVAELRSRQAYETVARENFGIAIPDMPALWERVRKAPLTGFLAGMDEAA